MVKLLFAIFTMTAGLAILGLVNAITIDNQLVMTKNDCFERVAIGEKISDKDVSRILMDTKTVMDCQSECSNSGQDCMAFSFGIGTKGNTTCLISKISIATSNLRPQDTQRDPDYDLYMRKLQCGPFGMPPNGTSTDKDTGPDGQKPNSNQNNTRPGYSPKDPNRRPGDRYPYRPNEIPPDRYPGRDPYDERRPGDRFGPPNRRPPYDNNRRPGSYDEGNRRPGPYDDQRRPERPYDDRYRPGPPSDRPPYRPHDSYGGRPWSNGRPHESYSPNDRPVISSGPVAIYDRDQYNPDRKPNLYGDSGGRPGAMYGQSFPYGPQRKPDGAITLDDIYRPNRRPDFFDNHIHNDRDRRPFPDPYRPSKRPGDYPRDPYRGMDDKMSPYDRNRRPNNNHIPDPYFDQFKPDMKDRFDSNRFRPYDRPGMRDRDRFDRPYMPNDRFERPAEDLPARDPYDPNYRPTGGSGSSFGGDRDPYSTRRPGFSSYDEGHSPMPGRDPYTRPGYEGFAVASETYADRRYDHNRRPPIVMHGYDKNGGRVTSIIQEIASQTPCFKRAIPGKRLSGGFIRRIVDCESLEDCHRLCADEFKFMCEGFNYKFDESGRGRGVCELTDMPLVELDTGHDFMPERDYDFYERDRNAEDDCGPKPSFGRPRPGQDYDDHGPGGPPGWDSDPHGPPRPIPGGEGPPGPPSGPGVGPSGPPGDPTGPPAPHRPPPYGPPPPSGSAGFKPSGGGDAYGDAPRRPYGEDKPGIAPEPYPTNNPGNNNQNFYVVLPRPHLKPFIGPYGDPLEGGDKLRPYGSYGNFGKPGHYGIETSGHQKWYPTFDDYRKNTNFIPYEIGQIGGDRYRPDPNWGHYGGTYGGLRNDKVAIAFWGFDKHSFGNKYSGGRYGNGGPIRPHFDPDEYYEHPYGSAPAFESHGGTGHATRPGYPSYPSGPGPSGPSHSGSGHSSGSGYISEIDHHVPSHVSGPGYISGPSHNRPGHVSGPSYISGPSSSGHIGGPGHPGYVDRPRPTDDRWHGSNEGFSQNDIQGQYGGPPGGNRYNVNRPGQFDWNTRHKDQFYVSHGGYGGWNYDVGGGFVTNVNDCSIRSGTGVRLIKNYILKSLIVPTIYECEKICYMEKKFKCKSYSYRYTITLEPPEDNCFLSERPLMDMQEDTEPHRDFDVYSMQPGGAKCMQPDFNYGTQSDCFWRTRSGQRLHSSVIRDVTSTRSLGQCELACIRTESFVCRSFSFRYGSPVIGEPMENCLLTDWPAMALDPDQLMSEPGHELYERGSFGHGCESDHFTIPAGPPFDQQVVSVGPDRTCYKGYGKPAKLLGRAIRKSLTVMLEEDCQKECTKMRRKGPPLCLSFSFRTTPKDDPRGSKTPNCDLSDVHQRDLRLHLDYTHDPDYWLFAWDTFHPKCQDFPDNSDPLGPPTGAPSGTTGYTSGTISSDEVKPTSSGSGEIYPTGPPGSSTSSTAPSSPSYGSSAEENPTGPPESPDKPGYELPKPILPPPRPSQSYPVLPKPSYRPHKPYPDHHHPPDFYPDFPHQKPRPTDYYPEQPPYYKPRPTDHYPEQPPYYKPRPTDHSLIPPYGKPRPNDYYPERPINRPRPNDYPDSHHYDGPSRPRPPFNSDRPDYRPNYHDHHHDQRPYEPYPKPHYRPRPEPLPSNKPGYPGSAENSVYSGESFSHHGGGWDVDRIGFGVGHVGETGDSTWQHYTVRGWPCRRGSRCEPNKIAGYWSCELEGGEVGSWDYCCRPSHRCGFSEGFDYPWCYVGPDKEQWRKCTEKYYPYGSDLQYQASDKVYEVSSSSEYSSNTLNNKPQQKPESERNKHPVKWVPVDKPNKFETNESPSHDNDEFLDPPQPGGFGEARYWPVAYLHKEPPPQANYTEYRGNKFVNNKLRGNKIDNENWKNLDNIHVNKSRDIDHLQDLIRIETLNPKNQTENKYLSFEIIDSSDLEDVKEKPKSKSGDTLSFELVDDYEVFSNEKKNTGNMRTENKTLDS